MGSFLRWKCVVFIGVCLAFSPVGFAQEFNAEALLKLLRNPRQMSRILKRAERRRGFYNELADFLEERSISTNPAETHEILQDGSLIRKILLRAALEETRENHREIAHLLGLDLIELLLEHQEQDSPSEATPKPLERKRDWLRDQLTAIPPSLAISLDQTTLYGVTGNGSLFKLDLGSGEKTVTELDHALDAQAMDVSSGRLAFAFRSASIAEQTNHPSQGIALYDLAGNTKLREVSLLLPREDLWIRHLSLSSAEPEILYFVDNKGTLYRYRWNPTRLEVIPKANPVESYRIWKNLEIVSYGEKGLEVRERETGTLLFSTHLPSYDFSIAGSDALHWKLAIGERDSVRVYDWNLGRHSRLPAPNQGRAVALTLDDWVISTLSTQPVPQCSRYLTGYRVQHLSESLGKRR